ncbi:MAG: thioester reductase domain-containing protein, partial [Myxococcales bacterium]|nr:thioester reductase domain-containing protein [Myxococcales bacterium]
DPAAAGERVREALAKYDLWRPEWAARLRAEPADLTAPRLGLSQARWDALALEVEAILHCGALVHFAQPYEALRAANVDGTLELLRLAGAVRRKRFDFISTKGVFSASAYPGDETIAEDDAVRRPSADTLSYQRSKWAAERLCWAAGARGLDVAIYRPGRIGGHSRSGQQNPDDLLCRFLIGCAQLGALPDIDVPVEVTPVDHVAATVARIAAAPGTCGRAYHLVHTAPLDPLGVRRALAACGLEVAVVGWRRWREQLFTQPTNALTPLRGLFTAEPPPRVHEGRLATANTLAADPRWSPPPVAEQLAVNLDYLRRAGLLAHDARGGADR